MKTARILVLIALLTGTVVGLPNLRGATIIVVNTNDNGRGSLRQALADAVDGDTIDFISGLSGQIRLTGGQLMVDKSLNIAGPGANRLAVNANHGSRVFYVASGKHVTISGLTIANGAARSEHSGGGVYNDHATLTLRSCTISGNTAEQGNGGGVFNDASEGSAALYLLSCTLSGNSAASGGGIYSERRGSATVGILNSTLSGNQATFGGAIYAGGDVSNGTRLYVFHSTLSGNSAISSGGGGGIYNAGALTQFANSVFNASSIFRASGIIRSLGYNLCSDDGSGFFTAAGDRIDTDPMLGPLHDNGGPTFTHSLLIGSPAIDSGHPSVEPYSFRPPLVYDQRGTGFARVVNDHVDIGAFEVQRAPAPTPTPTATARPTPTETPTPVRAPAASTALTGTPALASIALNPGTLTGGASSTGTVALTAAAPAGGVVVALTSNNLNVATVPASITVFAGATTAKFVVATKTVTVGTVAMITATYNGISKAVGLVVNPLLGSLTLNPSVLIGGAASTGTVTLNSAAPAGGTVVTLTSGNTNAATVPAAVTVAAGAKSASFAVATKAVTAVTQANITATCVGASRIVTLTLNPPLVGVTVNPAAVLGGVGSTGRVTLGTAAPAGGAMVTLASSNLNAATVPASVIVAAGATSATFAITTKVVTAVKAVTITATYSGMAKTTTLKVNPSLIGVTVNPATVKGGVGSTGTITLGAAAPAGGAIVALASSNLNAATVPASVTVPATATTATFPITTKAVTAATAVTIKATYGGVAKTATLTVNPPAAGLVGVTVNPAAVTGVAGSTGTVTLGAAAPAGGAIVTLASNNLNAATVPATVTVPANATTVNFAVTTKAVTAVTAVTITATYNGVPKTATLTVNPAGPAALAGVTMNPATVVYGANSTGTVTLTSAAPAGGAVIALTATNTIGFTVPASVTVPVGATTAQFTVGTYWFPATTTITATYNGVNKTATLTSVDATVVGLVCAPNPVIAGNQTICTVTMNGIMPADTTVFVLSDQPFFLPDSAGTVTVPAGAVSAAFSLTTTLVPDQIVAHISANALATATVTAPLTINLTNRGRKWVLNNVAFKDGGTATGYFTYDSATGQYLDVNIQVTPGPDPNNPLGQDPQNLYYYPWPNGTMATFVDNWSTASEMALQNPVTNTPVSWTYLQFNFARALTNAGGTIALVVNPNVAYTSYCTEDYAPTCTPPPGTISQESFALPDNLYGVQTGFFYRVVVSGSVTAQ